MYQQINFREDNYKKDYECKEKSNEIENNLQNNTQQVRININNVGAKIPAENNNNI